MTTAELTQWEVARGRLDATIAEQAKTIERLRNVIEQAKAWTAVTGPGTVLGDMHVAFTAALEDTRE